MRRLWRHIRSLWPRATLLPGAPFVAWALLSIARGERRWEMGLFGVVPPVLAYANGRTKRFFVRLVPLLLVAFVYDAQRLLGTLGLSPERVHACDLRSVDAALFGVTIGRTREPLPDWLQAHASGILDAFAAVPYGTYVFVTVAYAFFLYVRASDDLDAFVWSFFAVNVLGFITYRVFPAAPPWYVHAHGCAIDVAVRPDAGIHLAHVDRMIGIRYFGGFYARSRDVFGALPSLHVSYPLLIALSEATRRRALGAAAAGLFFLWMCFAAVYLDHHWVIDAVVGAIYTVGVYFSVRRILARAHEARSWAYAEGAPEPLRESASRGPRG